MRQNTSLTVIKHGALAHLARAFDWQSRGDQFESGMLHKSERIKKKFLVRFFVISSQRRNMKLIEMNLDKIIALCKKYKVAKLWVFGSILTPRFNDNSDIDFLVDFDENNIELLDYADNYFNFIHEIESVMGRKVDMVVNKSIKNRFFRTEVDETRRLIWNVL